MSHKIANVQVHLVSQPVAGGFTDATRAVETLGFTIVRITTDQGLEGIGVTYHEVGGEATKALIDRNITHKLVARDPLETEVLWSELTAYLRGVGRKGLLFCALSAIRHRTLGSQGKNPRRPALPPAGQQQDAHPGLCEWRLDLVQR